MAANRTIKVDMWSKIRERITVVQREILGRSLTFQIYSGATPINLTGGTVTLYSILPDTTTEIFNACTLTTPASGICTYTFTEATLLQAGDLRCWLIYVDSSANELRTQEFAIEVQASPDFTSSVEGTSEYNAFSTALSTYSGIDARVTDLETNHLLDAWPIGSIYMSVGSTSPATLFGGTWSVFGAGKVLVGIDSADADFDTVEETCGAKTVTLDTTMIPAHTHEKAQKYGELSSLPGDYEDPTLWGKYDTTSTTASLQTGSAGGGLAHNNIQPSIVVRMWKRTA